MKHLLLILALTTAALAPQARALHLLPYLGDLRAEVTNQLTIASNNVAANKRLIATLKGALKGIDNTKPSNYVAGATSLGALAKKLNRTVVSNAFNTILHDTSDTYVDDLLDAEGDLADRLDTTYLGKAHTAASTSLGKLLAAIEGANTNANLLTALKSLSTAAKNLGAAQKLVLKAENAPPPPSGFTATITGAVSRSFKAIGMAISSPVPNNFNVIASQPLTHAPYGQRIISFSIINLVSGNNVIPLGPGSSDVATFIYQEGATGDSFKSETGSVTVNYNPAAKTLAGSIDFMGKNSGGQFVHVTGSFSGHY